jgi:hypothetical protein
MNRKKQMLHLAEQLSELEDKNKKKRETYHLLLFLENFASFPAGTILPDDPPDFLVQTCEGRIGIELTEYFHESNNEHGSPVRAKETAEDRVLRRASSDYERRGLPSVDVFVHWSSSRHPTPSNINNLAANLVDLVECYLPEQGDTAIITDSCTKRDSLPEEVILLHIWRIGNTTKARWVPFGGIFPPLLTGPDLQDLLQKKEGKVPSYRQKCSQIWLLIVSNDLELPMIRLSKACELAPEAKDYPLETVFDRVFFLNCLERRVVELSRG